MHVEAVNENSGAHYAHVLIETGKNAQALTKGVFCSEMSAHPVECPSALADWAIMG